MKPEPVLIDLKKLRDLISKLDLDAKRKEYIDARWLNYIEWWDSRANRAKWRYHALRTAVVIGGALIPALVGLRELKVWPEGNDYSWLFAVASIVASLIVAICAGLESTFGFGDIWREKRNAAEIIKSEGFCFIQLCGPYREFKSHQDAFALFAENVEQLIRSEIKEYVLAVSPRPTAP
jgi:hypothetical protein